MGIVVFLKEREISLGLGFCLFVLREIAGENTREDAMCESANIRDKRMKGKITQLHGESSCCLACYDCANGGKEQRQTG